MFTLIFFFFQAEDGIRDLYVTGVQTCALPISGQPEQHPQRGGLAGAVGAHEAGDRAGLEAEAEVVDRGHRAVPLGEVVDLDAGHCTVLSGGLVGQLARTAATTRCTWASTSSGCSCWMSCPLWTAMTWVEPGCMAASSSCS